MKRTFITFGSHEHYVDAAARLLEQAKTLGLFDECILYTSEHLQADVDFWGAHHEFVRANARGYGYWLWKPFLIKRTMETHQDGDVLLYLDCGCELDITRKRDLEACIEVVKADSLVGTYTGCTERDWNKMDLIEKLGMNSDAHLNTQQRQAGALLFLVCDETRRFVDEWYRLGCEYHNIDDTPSQLGNFWCFREHRHDQSIYSLLTKKWCLYSERCTLDSAIHYLRNKTGVSHI
jgi:hypothetical protein